MKSQVKKALPAAILLAFSSVFAQAQETELAPVVVTANRVARTADETLSSVTVITRKEIEQQQAQSVADLLRGLPGVQMTNSGGPGKASALYLRGSNDGHTLLLLDGVKVGSATLGSASVQDIPVEMIERIEIVRGPRASLYGADAIGGVIQIFTKKGVQPFSLSMGGGSRGTYESALAGGFGSSDAWLNLGASTFSTHGINVKDGSTEPDRDPYSRSSFNVRGGGRLGENLNFDAQAQHTEGRSKYDGTPNVTDLKQDVYAASLRHAVNDNFTSSLKLGQSLDATTQFKDKAFSSRIDTRRSQAGWLNDLTLAKGHQLVGGLDYQYDEVLSNTKYDQSKRVNQAVFGQYLGSLGAFDLELAGRHDKNEQYGHHNTGSAALGYRFSPALRLRASHGTAFKAPSFNDLYWPGAGNPDLQPENARSSELGASGKHGDFEWQGSLFKSRVKNLIAWADNGSGTWIPSNVQQAHLTGLELSAVQKLGNTRLAASASFLNPKDHSGGANEGNLLARRARQSGRFDFDQKLGKWALGASWNAVGKRYSDAANSVKLGGYATTDLRAEYAINPEWRIQTRIENLFDKRYQTVSGYNQAGIGTFVTLRYQPK